MTNVIFTIAPIWEWIITNRFEIERLINNWIEKRR
jgi:hypothetical protein